MKTQTPLLVAILMILLAAGYLFSAQQKQQLQIQTLEEQNGKLQEQVDAQSASIQMLQLQQRKKPTLVQRPILPTPGNTLKDQVFKLLYLINGNASSENASVPKKIRYIPGQLIVQDAATLSEDRFFELLGLLLDEDQVKKVEIPKKTAFLTAQKELISFGLAPRLMSPSKDGVFRIIINDFNK